MTKYEQLSAAIANLQAIATKLPYDQKEELYDMVGGLADLYDRLPFDLREQVWESAEPPCKTCKYNVNDAECEVEMEPLLCWRVLELLR